MFTYYFTTKGLPNDKLYSDEVTCTFDVSKYVKIGDILESNSFFPRRVILDIIKESK